MNIEPDPDPINTIMERALAELAALFAQEAGESTAVCMNWVLVADWATVGEADGKTKGDRWITRWFDDRHPIWYRNALLDHARTGDWSQAQSGPAT